MWPREKFLDKDMIHAGTSLALVEMIRSGTVGFLDMYHLHMDIVAEAVVEAGLKGALSRGMIALGFTPQELKDKLNEAAVLAKGWESHESKRLKGFLFPHAPYTCTPDFLEAVADRARSENLPLSIHLAETKKEVARHEEEYGKRPVEHLDDLGFFESPVLAAHGVHVNSFEIKLLTDKNVSVSHNPLSNLKLGSGVAPVGEMMKQGLHLSIGTDSVVSNNNLDMFQEVRTAAILQKGFFHDASLVTAREALQMGTIHGAKAAGFTESGLIKEGYEADFILVDSSKPHLQPVENRVSHLVYSASGQDVTDVFVNGRAVMRNKELITLDEEKIVYEANNQYRRLNGLYRN
ncbi:amidohydrolase [Thalassobacillus sp. C254]|uniref:amidohydrolase n=1 Tax=Thalassobacillus sp. C254 TaxID=1225341 RepID=UPI0006D05C5F|nr:amidohydrolase [Thalassobacillus sp. C254]